MMERQPKKDDAATAKAIRLEAEIITYKVRKRNSARGLSLSLAHLPFSFVPG